jgi:hypothetical protein
MITLLKLVVVKPYEASLTLDGVAQRITLHAPRMTPAGVQIRFTHKNVVEKA